jgi:hypothetical protein
MRDLKIGVERTAEPICPRFELDLRRWRSGNVDDKLGHGGWMLEELSAM